MKDIVVEFTLTLHENRSAMMMTRSLLTVVVIACAASIEPSGAQTPFDQAQGRPFDQAQGRPQFEVVSIKPTQPGSRGGPGPFVNTTPGRLVTRGTLSFFIEYAYGINGMYVEGGPGWVRSDRYDIEARQPAGSESFPLLRDMLRAALADRFKLMVRQQRRDLPVLLLTVAKGGPKLTPSAPDDEAQTRGRPGELLATKISMVGLASQLSRSVGRIVQDRTGLPGVYNITLRASDDGFQRTDPLGRSAADPDAPSIATALEEQLGLKLESGRGPVDVLIIDRAERPTAD